MIKDEALGRESFAFLDKRRQILQSYASKHNLKPTGGVELCRDGSMVTIVIPALNEADFIPDTLRSLDKANSVIGGRAECVIVDNGSQDKTLNIVEKLKSQVNIPLTILTENKKGPGNARKRGMDEVVAQYINRGDFTARRILALTDADTQVHPLWLQAIINSINFNNTQAIGGVYRYPVWVDQKIEQAVGIKDYFGRLSEIIYFLLKNNCAVAHTNGTNSALEVEAYSDIDGSKQPVNPDGGIGKGSDRLIGEELRRKGYKVGVLPAVNVQSPRRAILSIVRRKDPAYFYNSARGWVNCRGKDGIILDYLLKTVPKVEMESERTLREQYFIDSAIVAPLIYGQLDSDNFVELLGADILPFLEDVENLNSSIYLKGGEISSNMIAKSWEITQIHAKNIIDLVSSHLDKQPV